MTVRLRLILALSLFIVGAFYYLFDFINNNMRPQYLETVEESLNDTAVIFASLAQTDNGLKMLAVILDDAKRRTLKAEIYGFEKEEVEVDVYVTNNKGIVIFDSSNKILGSDYSRWNDVYLTLQGKYGVRSTRTVPDDPATGALYVAAPIKKNGKIVGSLTVVKPKRNLNILITRARKKIYTGIILTVIAILVFSLLVTLWVTRPISKLTRYAKELAAGKKNVSQPIIHAPEMNNLLQAFEQMRTELEGKKYVERYVRSLTHELRSPLSGLGAALEILEDDLSVIDRKKFLDNARAECSRLQSLSDHILTLATLENRSSMTKLEGVFIEELLVNAKKLVAPERNEIRITIPKSKTLVKAMPVILEQAIVSLFQNALDFSPENSEIECLLEPLGDIIKLSILDQGAGIPSFAMKHIFEKFYSTERPCGRRSSGLGLAFVKEVIEIHHGSIGIKNNKTKSGVTVEIVLPYV